MHARWQLLRRLGALVAAMLVLGTAACVHVFGRTDVRAVNVPESDRTDSIRSPVKVHLADGSTVLFRKGAHVSRTRIAGAGAEYALLGTVPRPRTEVPMDSVVAVEAFEGGWLPLESIAVSLAATAVTAVAVAGLAVAVFGSCPTVYSDTGSGPVLEAEGFSYAMAPLLEHRDVDPLGVRPDADGTIRLELRNEALETHFINHVELLAIRHPSAARVVPDQGGRPVAVGDFVPLERARDRAGRDVRPAIVESDGRVFASDARVVERARDGDLDDWIDLEVSELPPGDSIAVVLRMRNSLLNTILLYEGMLGGRDAADWLAHDLQRIATTVDLASWYVRTMGMRASVDGVPLPGDRPYEGHARVGDVGPIAFREVALVLPRPAADGATARVRLRFVADNWRIDQVRVAGRIGRPTFTVLPVDSVVVPTPAAGGAPVLDHAAVTAIADPDDRYLETRPGQRMRLVFRPDTSRPAADSTATYLLAWQGWYREWIRGSWLAAPTRDTPFVPGDREMIVALRRWSAKQESFERQFYSSKIPVR